MNLEESMQICCELEEELFKCGAKRSVLEETVKEDEKRYQKLKEELDIAVKTQALIQEAAQITLSSISIKIDNIVTKVLQTVFSRPYTFHLEFRILYGKLATDMYLERDGKRYDPKIDNGDGTVDIIALALRVAVICLDKRNLRRLLILDEPCGALSVNFQEYLGRMLEYFSKNLNFQIFMIAAHGSNLNIESAKYFDVQNFIENGEY
jgi:hypothetical protein